MPRKVTKKLQRQLQPDRKYQSVLVQRLINKSMLDGKKLVAERAVYHEQTEVLVDFYSKLEGEHAPKYIKVDGTQPVEAVKAEVLGALGK